MFRHLLLIGLVCSCGRGSASLEPGCGEEGLRYDDVDGDGYGDDATGVPACDAPDGSVDVGGDCDDADSTVSPSAEDLCGDGVDSDCDGRSDRCDVSLGDAAAKLVGRGGSDLAGDSVASGGDVNGDGLPDILVGAAGRGAGYLVLGPVRGTVDLEDAHASIVGGLDCSVASAGDVNGDGLGDIVVGSPEGGGGAGFLLLGPVTGVIDPKAVPAIFIGEQSAGAAVAGAGDVDGDGHDDLLLGAYASDLAGEDAGAAYLVHGPVSGLVELDDAQARLVGENSHDHAGRRVSSAGDVDGDGLADLLVSAPDHASGGAVYLLLSPVSGTVDLATADGSLVGEGRGDLAGSAVSSVGDMDGDGNDDILVGAYGSDVGAGDAGAAYLMVGSFSGTLSLSLASARLVGEQAGAHVGNAVAGAGDVNGDGRGDLLVGAVADDDAGEDAGAAYVILGPVSGTIDLRDADVKLVGENTGAFAGDAVAIAGDQDGDGVDDILVGASNDPEGGSYAGAVYLVLGGHW